MKQALPTVVSMMLATIVAIGIVGCGGRSAKSASPVALGRSFQGRAAAVCRTALAQKKAQGPFPYPNFNPTRPDLAKLPAIGRLEAKTVSIYQAWLRDLLALSTPPRGEAAWARVISALKQNGRIIADQRDAAQRIDGSQFTKDYFDGNKAQRELETAADASGLPACSAAAAA